MGVCTHGIQLHLTDHRNGPIKNHQMSHVQYVIVNDGKMSDGKLLSKDKMLLIAKQPLPTSTVFVTSIIHVINLYVLIIQHHNNSVLTF